MSYHYDDNSHLLNAINDIAISAGDAIMKIYNSADFGVEFKDDSSPLTLADKAAHEVIVTGLKKLNIGPILSEEDANISWQERSTWDQYWLVDPLDGTKEFIKKNGEFTVNIALVKNGEPVLGSVYAPAKDLLFYGAAGFGAFKSEAVKTSNHPIKMSPSAVPSSDRQWRIVGSRSHQSEDFKEFISKFSSADIVAMGSSLKLCLVAEGKADLYPRLGLTSEWDTAAAQAVVEAAGGKVLNWETLMPLRYNQKDSLLNPFFIVCSETSPVWFEPK